MYKIYFKQAILMLKQNIFMSIIAITGTALAIMMIMTIIVSEEMKNVPVAPEVHRDRTLYLHFHIEKDTAETSWSYGDVKLENYRKYLNNMQVPEMTSAITNFWVGQSSLINLPGSKEYVPAFMRSTDPQFWKIFSFTFIEGTPFSQAAFESGVKDAVISESLARTLFKGAPALGQTFDHYKSSYRIVGVVKDVSAIFNTCYSDIWIPYTSENKGGATVIMLMRSKKDYPALLKEIEEAERKYFQERGDWTLSFNLPATHRELQMNPSGGSAAEIRENLRNLYKKRIFILFILLMVPAINLSGLSNSRIKKRMEEIGIRKAFGAKRHIILIQVLFENLITSVIGGVIGLILSYVVIFNMKQWLLNIAANQAIPLNTLISFPVIIAICLLCIILNLLSAGIPAWKAANITIIRSITQNDKNR